MSGVALAMMGGGSIIIPYGPIDLTGTTATRDYMVIAQFTNIFISSNLRIIASAVYFGGAPETLKVTRSPAAGGAETTIYAITGTWPTYDEEFFETPGVVEMDLMQGTPAGLYNIKLWALRNQYNGTTYNAAGSFEIRVS